MQFDPPSPTSLACPTSPAEPFATRGAFADGHDQHTRALQDQVTALKAERLVLQRSRDDMQKRCMIVEEELRRMALTADYQTDDDSAVNELSREADGVADVQRGWRLLAERRGKLIMYLDADRSNLLRRLHAYRIENSTMRALLATQSGYFDESVGFVQTTPKTPLPSMSEIESVQRPSYNNNRPRCTFERLRRSSALESVNHDVERLRSCIASLRQTVSNSTEAMCVAIGRCCTSLRSLDTRRLCDELNNVYTALANEKAAHAQYRFETELRTAYPHLLVDQ